MNLENWILYDEIGIIKYTIPNSKKDGWYKVFDVKHNNWLLYSFLLQVSIGGYIDILNAFIRFGENGAIITSYCIAKSLFSIAKKNIAFKIVGNTASLYVKKTGYCDSNVIIKTMTSELNAINKSKITVSSTFETIDTVESDIVIS